MEPFSELICRNENGVWSFGFQTRNFWKSRRKNPIRYNSVLFRRNFHELAPKYSEKIEIFVIQISPQYFGSMKRGNCCELSLKTPKKWKLLPFKISPQYFGSNRIFMLNFPKFWYLILITYIVKLKITLFKKIVQNNKNK